MSPKEAGSPGARPRSVVIGTAGHIDHGKTTLVRALTGIDTDRLEEEKRRGISIDLGFASTTLPGGYDVSFVDVPGHEHYLKNMLAGAGGFGAVMLVVAADDGVKPQTHEHFQICRLLGVADGLVAITKCDDASAEQIDSTEAQIRHLCRNTFLDGKAIVRVSAQTGSGLDTLQGELAKLVSRHQESSMELGRVARLPVDRSFVLKGFGTVVTGTLTGGRLGSDRPLFLNGNSAPVRIRGLEQRGAIATDALAGERLAVNLAAVEASEVRRGAVLSASPEAAAVSLLDIALQWLEADDDRRPRRQQVLVYAGTAEIPASLKIIDPQHRYGRLYLASAAVIFPGDHLVLRRPSPPAVLGGAQVLDIDGPGRLNRKALLERDQMLHAATDYQRLLQLTAEAGNTIAIEVLTRRTGFTREHLSEILAASDGGLWIDADSHRIISRAWIQDMGRRLIEFLTGFHHANPNLQGASVAQTKIGAQTKTSMEGGMLRTLLRSVPEVQLHGDVLSLRSHRVQQDPKLLAAMQAVERLYWQAGYAPPPLEEMGQAAGLESARLRTVLDALVKQGRLLRISNDLIFHAGVVGHVTKSLAAHKGRKFSVPEFKEWTKISRKYAIPLLEFLDRQRVTRREGDLRVVL